MNWFEVHKHVTQTQENEFHHYTKQNPKTKSKYMNSTNNMHSLKPHKHQILRNGFDWYKKVTNNKITWTKTHKSFKQYVHCTYISLISPGQAQFKTEYTNT